MIIRNHHRALTLYPLTIVSNAAFAVTNDAPADASRISSYCCSLLNDARKTASIQLDDPMTSHISKGQGHFTWIVFSG